MVTKTTTTGRAPIPEAPTLENQRITPWSRLWNWTVMHMTLQAYWILTYNLHPTFFPEHQHLPWDGSHHTTLPRQRRISKRTTKILFLGAKSRLLEVTCLLQAGSGATARRKRVIAHAVKLVIGSIYQMANMSFTSPTSTDYRARAFRFQDLLRSGGSIVPQGLGRLIATPVLDGVC
jgi:hypothetical protein